jgi:nucleotidyltransferase substrate binding protein (TIGR01987 family)
MLDLKPLERAIAQLEQALAYAGSDLAKTDPGLAPHLRAVAIQAFEFTYERSYKMLRRHLEMTEGSPSDLATFSFNRLIRLGYERGLLGEELAVWMRFREARGTTSHTYDEHKAQAVFEAIPGFLDEARFLLGQLHARRADVP